MSGTTLQKSTPIRRLAGLRPLAIQFVALAAQPITNGAFIIKQRLETVALGLGLLGVPDRIPEADPTAIKLAILGRRVM